MVGDGHTVSVAAQIVQHIFGATEGTFQIDYPVLSKQRPRPGGKDLGLSEEFQISLEAKLTVLKSLFEGIDELAAKDFTQHPFGKKVVVSRTNPAAVIGREAAGRNDTMDMGMNFEFLALGM